LTAEFVDDFTKIEGDIGKLWQKALIFIIGKRGKKSILAGSGRYRNRHDEISSNDNYFAEKDSTYVV